MVRYAVMSHDLSVVYQSTKDLLGLMIILWIYATLRYSVKYRSSQILLTKIIFCNSYCCILCCCVTFFFFFFLQKWAIFTKPCITKYYNLFQGTHVLGQNVLRNSDLYKILIFMIIYGIFNIYSHISRLKMHFLMSNLSSSLSHSMIAHTQHSPHCWWQINRLHKHKMVYTFDN